MGKTYETAIKLAAKLDKGFDGTLTRAEKALASVGKAAEKLKKAEVATKTFRRLQDEVGDTEKSLDGAREELRRVTQEMLGAEKVTDDMRRRWKDARRTVSSLERSLESKRRKLADVGDELRDAGVDTRNLAREQARLQRELRKTERRMSGLSKIASVDLKGSLRDVGRELRSIGTIAGGVLAGGLVYAGKKASSVEDALADLSTLESVTNEQLIATHKAAVRWTEAHGGTVEKYLGAAYTAVSSTITDTEAAIAATEQASKLAKATRDDEGKAMSALGTLYTITADKARPAVDELERLSDILAKTQQEAKIEDLSQLADSFRYGLPAGKAWGVQLEQIAAITGQLNTSGLEGSMGGTGFRSALNQMPKAIEKLRKYDESLQMVQPDGHLDVLATIRAMEPAIAEAEKQGKSAGEVLSWAFGSEAMGAVVALRDNLDAVEDAQARYADMAGTTQRAFDKLDATRSADVARMRARAENRVADAGNRVLELLDRQMPAIERLIDRIPAGLEAMIDVAGGIMDVVDALGGLDTVLYGIAAIKLAPLAAASYKLATNFGKFADGVGTLLGAGNLGTMAGTLIKGSLAISAVVWGIEKLSEMRAREAKFRGGIETAVGRAAAAAGDRAGTLSAIEARAASARTERIESYGGDIEAFRAGAMTPANIVRDAVTAASDVLGGQVINVDFRPQITVTGGGAGAGQDVQTGLRAVVGEFERVLRDAQRRSYQ